MAKTPDSEQTVVMSDGITDPRFKLIERLGSGGMGDVYLAEDSTLRRRVAIKTVRPDLCRNEEIHKRIERECLLHARVGAHPHIVTLFDKLEKGDSINLVMEYVDGKTLSDMVKDCAARGEKMPEKDALNVAIQCLDALSRIHAQGIVHRDIKPQNLLVSRDDSGAICAKLMDFGIARLQDPDEQATALTSTEGSGPGTPAYMAPEQIDPKTFGHVSPATDIYAVGIMVYQLLSGETPFSGSITEVFRGHLTSVPPGLSPRSTGAIPGPLIEILQRALAKNPKDRFPSAKAFKEDLIDVLSGTAAPQPQTPDTARTMLASRADASALQKGGTMLAGATVRPSSGRKTGLVIAIVVLAVIAIGAMGVAAWFLVGPGKTSEPTPAPQPSPAESPAPSAVSPTAPQTPESVATPPPASPVVPAPAPTGAAQQPSAPPPATLPPTVTTPLAVPPAARSAQAPPEAASGASPSDVFEKYRSAAPSEPPSPPTPPPAPKVEPKPATEAKKPEPPKPEPKPEPPAPPKPAPQPQPSAQTPPPQPPAQPDWLSGVSAGSSSSQKK